MKLARLVIALSVLYLVTLTFGFNLTSNANQNVEFGEKAILDINLSENIKAQVSINDGSQLNINAHSAENSQMRLVADKESIFDIYLLGEGSAVLEASGSSELNIFIDGDIMLNLQAGEEVIVNISEVIEEPVNKVEESNAVEETTESEMLFEEVLYDELNEISINLPIGIGAMVPVLALMTFFIKYRYRDK